MPVTRHNNGQELAQVANLIKHRAHTTELIIQAQRDAGSDDYSAAYRGFADIEALAANAPNWVPTDDQSGDTDPDLGEAPLEHKANE